MLFGIGSNFIISGYLNELMIYNVKTNICVSDNVGKKAHVVLCNENTFVLMYIISMIMHA